MTILSVARAFALELLAHERRSATQMVKAWASAWERIDLELRALIERIDQAIQRGETISESWLWRRGRLEDLLIQAGRETARFAQFAELETLNGKAEAVRLATESGDRYLALPRRVDGLSVHLAFNRAPQEALQALVGTFQDGSPLARLFRTFGQAEQAGIQEALVRGLVTGKSPRVVARDVRDAGGMPLNRALTISRTEQLRAYRSASLENYRANPDTIEGWVWVAKLDGRTCPVCWAMAGTEHTLSEEFSTHVNCRCSPSPRVIGIKHRVPSGAARFAELPEDDQLQILGPGKFELYRRGELALADLVQSVDHPAWGPGIREASLEDLQRRGRRAA